MKTSTIKQALLATIAVLAFSTKSIATEIKDVEMFGYARAGIGTNTLGGDQECFYNQGSGGWNGDGRNEFRLGNECSNYLEVGTKLHHLKGDKKWAYTQFRLANSTQGSDAYETNTTKFVELFAEGYGLNELPMSVWIGKRFYRDQDVHMDDYYYMGNMSSNGGGIGRIQFLGGELNLAYLKEISTVGTVSSTEKGQPAASYLDVRFKNFNLADNIKQNLWLSYGSAPGGTTTDTSATTWVKTDGFAVGALTEVYFENGFNHFAVIYGKGLLNSLNVYGDSSVTSSENETQNKTERLRLVNHTTYKLNTNWQGHFSASHETVRVSSKTTEEWTSIGVRPTYLVTDDFHLVTEFGTSQVNMSGLHRKLSRVTLAPQLSVNSNIWGRPVFRAFYTQSFWNDDNKSFVGQKAPSFADKNSGGSYGLQMETFF